MGETIRRWFTAAPDSLVAGTVRKDKSPWSDAVHLLWSFWVFITPVFSHYTWRWAAITAVTYPVFVALYARSCLDSRRVTHRYGLALVAMALALLPWYPSGLSYFIYGCVLISSCRISLPRYLLVLVVLNALCVGEAAWLQYPWQAWIPIPVTSFIIGITLHAERISEQKNAELQLSHDEVRRLAATAERERIGRDLHDLLGHTLSLITLKLELSRKLFDRDSEAARREMAEAESVARHALAEVRAAVTGIRATDLAAELASARLLLGASAVHLDYELGVTALPEATERHLALVIREASTNIVRHARASEARVRLHCDQGDVVLDICDNGRGGLAEDGNGLRGMRERVRTIGGQLAIESPRGQGTHLTVRVRAPSVEPLALPGWGEDPQAAAPSAAGRSAA